MDSRVHEHFSEEDEGEATDADIEAAEERARRRERSAGSRSRSKAKAKASRMYDRQFAGNDAASAGASSGGPRAAVYKGEMGRSHKRAFEDLGGTDAERRHRASRSSSRRSTRDDAAGSGIGGSRVAESVRNLKPERASRLFVVLAVLIVLAVVGIVLYPSAKGYYTSIREEARLEAQYEALSSRNADLQEQIDSLSTDEGVQDAAREKLGWVENGEQSIIVEGLSDPNEEQDKTETLYDSTVDVNSIQAPETWYSPVLDVVFGYNQAGDTSQDASSDASTSSHVAVTSSDS